MRGGDRERNRKGAEFLLSVAKELLLGTKAGWYSVVRCLHGSDLNSRTLFNKVHYMVTCFHEKSEKKSRN